MLFDTVSCLREKVFFKGVPGSDTVKSAFILKWQEVIIIIFLM